MIELNFCSHNIEIANIKKDDLPDVLEWYNNIEDNIYGTGVDKPLTQKDILTKYLESAISRNDFFSWVYDSAHNRVGIIKGSIKYQEKDSVWINSLVIGREYRRKGLGRMSVDALVEHLAGRYNLSRAYVSVVEDNLPGIEFWRKIGFIEVKRLDNHIMLENKYRNVIIMSKSI